MSECTAPVPTALFCMPGRHAEPIPEGRMRLAWSLEPATSIGGEWYVNRHPAPSTSVWVCPAHALHDYHDDVDGCFPGCPAWRAAREVNESEVNESQVNQSESVTDLTNREASQ